RRHRGDRRAGRPLPGYPGGPPHPDRGAGRALTRHYPCWPRGDAMRVMARLPAVLAAGWAASWTIIFLEIFRWHHMSRTLRFTPPAPLPGMPGPPTPG